MPEVSDEILRRIREAIAGQTDREISFFYHRGHSMVYNPVQYPKMLYHPVTKEPLIVKNAREMEQAVSWLGYGFSPAIDPTPGQTHPGALHPFDAVVQWCREGNEEWNLAIANQVGQLHKMGVYEFLPKGCQAHIEKAKQQGLRVNTHNDGIARALQWQHSASQVMNLDADYEIFKLGLTTQGAQQMIEFAKEIKVGMLDMDGLMLALGLCKLTEEQYAATEVDGPKWLAQRRRTIQAEIKKRLADDLLRAEEELEALKEKEERRNELKARIEKLRGKISEQV